jgi:hypothetical protein
MVQVLKMQAELSGRSLDLKRIAAEVL